MRESVSGLGKKACDGYIRTNDVTEIPPSVRCLLPCDMFNFGQPKTVGDWIVHIAGAIVALFLIWWMLRVYVL